MNPLDLAAHIVSRPIRTRHPWNRARRPRIFRATEDGPMDYLLSCDSVRLVAAPDRRDWERRGQHPMESLIRAAANAVVPVLITAGKTRATRHCRPDSPAEQLQRSRARDPGLRVAGLSLRTGAVPDGRRPYRNGGAARDWRAAAGDATPSSSAHDGRVRVAADGPGRALRETTPHCHQHRAPVRQRAARHVRPRSVYRLNTFQITGT